MNPFRYEGVHARELNLRPDTPYDGCILGRTTAASHHASRVIDVCILVHKLSMASHGSASKI
jgi:hypothetical protein